MTLVTHNILSAREQECLVWAAHGKTSWETGVILGISERTVNFHLQNACRKLRVNGRRAAILLAMHRRLIHPLPPWHGADMPASRHHSAMPA
ncbi:helix-turn-helix domain-containing protein [Kerstersia gyiorum]|jgi:DNA-binding CsgD family transcriptional regulator|uniref:Transcriptional regulator n=1 Tax=Kerstersia gyiorum TaxID=206506 RepID=A0A4Q7MZ45_9BURK|nr:helix-turn-helix transcriptional regulator [Kerstersia gyiorum]AZV94886.1 hypothetical protein CBF45_15120 [Bordetella sp. J329]KAB0544981.1 helix-turn-helix transcriptional regulator [Kerstersia gyiorum]MCP1632239.1 DNA-binding CsgD family transcriptional regulator [Kerstersia gyiorum]MCP1635254.1 DNA-binding CsgD family transcriptional regulator [Kerstersia gyiorum]MCP1669819.1 DNA-binding CsgD family transcriptional regulator [Kerstersia gyiorum]